MTRSVVLVLLLVLDPSAFQGQGHASMRRRGPQPRVREAEICVYEYVYERGDRAMGGSFDHERLRVYQAAIDFVAWLEGVYPGTERKVPAHDHLVRASASVPVNVAEGNGKFSTKDRCRFIGHARTAALQAAADLDVTAVRTPQLRYETERGKALLADSVRMLVAWQRSVSGN